MNNGVSGANMFGLTFAVTNMLFGDITNNAAATTNAPSFPNNTNRIWRLHGGKHGNVVFLDGHGGKFF